MFEEEPSTTSTSEQAPDNMDDETRKLFHNPDLPFISSFHGIGERNLRGLKRGKKSTGMEVLLFYLIFKGCSLYFFPV